MARIYGVSNILLFLVVRNTDYAQIGLLQFFIFYGVCKMDDLFMYFFTSSIFLTGHLSSFEMCSIGFSLSLFSFLQSYSRWSTVWLPLAQGHSGDSIILNRCRYDLVFPWAVTIAVKLGVELIFIFNLSFMFRKISSVTYPLVVLSHSCCHFSMLFSLSWCSISLFGILL